ncbi:MAG: right-handed parallel beta-helix repeat-containing protein, partial [Bacteroidota bacterium]
MINKYGIFAMLLTISLVVEAKDYYVSNDGNDSFSGTSLSEAFQTLERLNEVHLKPGDKILLKRGDVFMGSIVVNSSGKADAPIIIGAYGIGSNPVIKGSVRVPGIKKQKENTYTFHLEKQVKNLFVNDKMMIPARYPNLNQYLRSDNDKNETPMGMLYDKDLDFEDGYWEGATLVYRGTDWTYDWVTIDKFENNTFYFDSMEVRYRPRKGYGYFIQHKAELLDTINEFFYDKESKTCHFITKDNVSGNMSGVEAVVLDYAILLADGISHVKIENLEFTKFHEAGIIARSNNNFITINNCSIKQIEKVGIWFQDKALKCEISDCVLEEICGRGISLTQSSYNSVIRDKVSRVGLFPGLGTHGVNGMSGIVVEARNERYNRLLDTENFKSDSNYIA